jgi:hypothetical protein
MAHQFAWHLERQVRCHLRVNQWNVGLTAEREAIGGTKVGELI